MGIKEAKIIVSWLSFVVYKCVPGASERRWCDNFGPTILHREPTSTFSTAEKGGNEDNVQFEIDDFFIELNSALHNVIFGPLSTLATDYDSGRNQLWNFRHYHRHNFVFFHAAKLTFSFFFQLFSFVFILFGWHKNYHFHKLQAIIVTWCFTSRFTCQLPSDCLSLFDIVLFLHYDSLWWTRRSSSRCNRAFRLYSLWSCGREFQVFKLLVG